MTKSDSSEATKSPDVLMAERRKRIEDAIQLKQPDRVPIFIMQELFPATYAGITYKDAFYDQEKWLAANEKTILDFAPDAFFGMLASTMHGKVWERLGYCQHKWPGHNLDPDVAWQFVEGEYLKADEYDHFLSDPSDFLLRIYLPRTHTALAGLGMLPPLKSIVLAGAAGLSPLLLAPPVASALTALTEAAPGAAAWAAGEQAFYQKMESYGFQPLFKSISLAPFDMLTDFFRGLRGIMLDIYRRPDKLLAAQAALLPFLVESAVGMAQASGNNLVFIPLHRGADGFMSIQQFEEFYWPGLKQLMLDLIDAGLTPFPFYEGTYDKRLEYLREMPKGKVVSWFDRTDLVKAKEIIGDVTCIVGGMPVSLLHSGTTEEIRAHTRQVIETVGKDGGFIMSSSTSFNDVNPKAVKTWFDATQEYGGY